MPVIAEFLEDFTTQLITRIVAALILAAAAAIWRWTKLPEYLKGRWQERRVRKIAPTMFVQQAAY
jgi:hypothetical protein